MTRRGIPRHRAFFVACEGESESGYARLLQQFAGAAGLRIQILAEAIKKTGGEPMRLIANAQAVIECHRKRNSLAGRFLLLDADRIAGPGHRREVQRAAEAAGLSLVWQDKCFEAMLLRHFKGRENDNPATSREALSRLQKLWPEYDKGMAAMDLHKRISLEDVRRAAASPLNADLAVLLKALGLLSGK